MVVVVVVEVVGGEVGIELEEVLDELVGEVKESSGEGAIVKGMEVGLRIPEEEEGGDFLELLIAVRRFWGVHVCHLSLLLLLLLLLLLIFVDEVLSWVGERGERGAVVLVRERGDLPRASERKSTK